MEKLRISWNQLTTMLSLLGLSPTVGADDAAALLAAHGVDVDGFPPSRLHPAERYRVMRLLLDYFGTETT